MQQGLFLGALPTAVQLQALHAATLPALPPPQQRSSVEAYRDEIAALRARGLEAAAIRVRLEERHSHPVSFSAVWRLLQHLRATEGATARERGQGAVVRVEVPPGREAQVDFGYAGLSVDPHSGAVRKTWVFVMVLACSRHLYAELVFDQRIATWLVCHAHAFAAFGGVPARVVPDNLKAAVVRASFTEPEATQAYRECAEHDDFLIDPNPPRSPHLKGKVEQGGVHYVKRNYLAGRCAPQTPPPSIDPLNRGLRRWCVEAGMGRPSSSHSSASSRSSKRRCVRCRRRPLCRRSGSASPSTATAPSPLKAPTLPPPIGWWARRCGCAAVHARWSCTMRSTNWSPPTTVPVRPVSA